MSAELAKGERRTMELMKHNRLLKDTLKAQGLDMAIVKNEEIAALQLEVARPCSREYPGRWTCAPTATR